MKARITLHTAPARHPFPLCGGKGRYESNFGFEHTILREVMKTYMLASVWVMYREGTANAKLLGKRRVVGIMVMPFHT